MKKIFSIILLFSIFLSLYGCHGARETLSFSVPEEFDASQSYEITFWAKNDTNKAQTDIYEKAIRDFEALYPNIHVNLRLYTDYGRIYNDVITNIATGTTPDVCITYPDHIATYLSGDNVVVPLDSLMENSDYGLGGSNLAYDAPSKEEMVAEYLEECKIGGVTYALPYMRSTEVCYINKNFVEALGYSIPETLSWDFIWEVSEAAMEKNADGIYKLNNQQVMIPFIYKSTDNMMIQMTRQLGSGYSNGDGEILLFNDITKQLLATVAEHAKTGAFSTFKISSYPANFLNAGQCIFAIDSTAGSTWMGAEAPLCDIAEEKRVDFETVVMTIPQYDAEHPQMISQGPSLCIFNKTDPQQVLASWIFAQYLLTNDVQIAYAETEGYVPVTRKAQDSEAYQDYLSREGEDNNNHYAIKLQATKLLLDNIAHTFVTPVFNGSASLRDAAGQLIEDTTKSVRRKQTVDDAFLNQLFENVTSLYRLDQISLDGNGGKKDLGPLPAASIALLSTLAIVWVLLAVFAIRNRIKSKKSSNSVH